MKHFLHSYSDELSRELQALDPAEFEKAVELLVDAYHSDRQVFIAGNGGSAGTANHFVCDFGKNAVQGGRRRFRILSVCDNIEKLTAFCKENISSEHLLGMMQTTWERIDPDWMHVHHTAAEHIAIAKQQFENN